MADAPRKRLRDASPLPAEQEPPKKQKPTAPRPVLQNLPPDLRVAFYDMNSTRCLSVNEARFLDGKGSKAQAKSEAMNQWIETCKREFCNAIKDEYLDVIAVVGIGPYAVGLHKKLPSWLHEDDSSRGVGLLRYIVEDEAIKQQRPAGWKFYLSLIHI